MITAPEEFFNACKHGGVRASRLQIVDDDGHTVYNVPVSSGSVSVTWTDAVRTSMSAEIESAVLDLVPRDDTSAINMIDTQLRVKSGWIIDGEDRLVTLGMFRLETSSVNRSPDGRKISITAMDRACLVQPECPRPMAFQSGTPFTSVVKSLVRERYPNARFSLPEWPSLTVANIMYGAKSNLWEEARNLVASFGFSLFFDRYGVCRMSSATQELKDQADLRFPADYPIFEVDRNIDMKDFYNGVVVYGTHTSNVPIYGEAWITDVDSPYYYLGKMGKRPKLIESEKVNSIPQAVAMAREELSKMITKHDSVSFKIIPNAALDVGDIFFLEDDDSGTSGKFFVTGFEFPLDPKELMTVTGGKML